jgi:hypothetical protein
VRRTFWTAAQLALLHKNYPHLPTERVARIVGRDVKSVYAKANSLRLRKSAAYLASDHSGRITKLYAAGMPHRFRAGLAPWNKGKIGWQAGGRSVVTQFKPGQRSKRWDPELYAIGALRLNADDYVDIKIAEQYPAWRPFHAWLWEQEHGRIPAGHAVVFRDGDRMNIELANLELVSRAELMRRNTVHRLPAPLRSAIQLVGQLKRRIREREDRRPA